MKASRAIGMIRLLQPILARARRRWRGGPLVPMIWRRRFRARPETPHKPAPPISVTHNSVTHDWAFNLSLVWPAGTAARAGPLRRVETRLREHFRAGRDTGGRETSRLVALVERLWLRSVRGEGDLRAAAGQAQSNALQWASSPPPGSEGQVVPLQERRAPVGAATASRDSAVAPRESAAASRESAAASRDNAAAPRDVEGGAARLFRMGAPRIRRPRPMRAGAIRHWNEPPAAGAQIAPAAPELFSSRAVAATTIRRAAAARAERPMAALRPPSRARAPLVWRKDEPGGERPAATPGHGHAHRTPGAELVWRRVPPAGPTRDEAGAAHDVAASVPGRSDGDARADRPSAPTPTALAAPAASAPAAMQPAEMSRLVDEVVRRLDRIGRDERMRRGI